MSTIYYPAADPGDHEHELIKGGVSSPHQGYGTHVGYIEVGTPGGTKNDMVYKPIFHVTFPDEGKLYTDVVSAKLYLCVHSYVGDPGAATYVLKRCTQYDWYDYHTHTTGRADYTCYQHSGGAWSTAWGDFTDTDSVDVPVPSATGWFSTDITALVVDAIRYRTRDLNLGIWPPEAASLSWNFYCKHSLSGGVPYNRWYVEVEWAAVAAALGQAYVIG